MYRFIGLNVRKSDSGGLAWGPEICVFKNDLNVSDVPGHLGAADSSIEVTSAQRRIWPSQNPASIVAKIELSCSESQTRVLNLGECNSEISDIVK